MLRDEGGSVFMSFFSNKRKRKKKSWTQIENKNKYEKQWMEWEIRTPQNGKKSLSSSLQSLM